MHQPCECRTVYHPWKHCSLPLSARYSRSPAVGCSKPGSICFDSASDLWLRAVAYIRENNLIFHGGLCRELPPNLRGGINKMLWLPGASLCCRHDPFHSAGPIDFFQKATCAVALHQSPHTVWMMTPLIHHRAQVDRPDTDHSGAAQPCNGAFCVAVLTSQTDQWCMQGGRCVQSYLSHSYFYQRVSGLA